MKFSIIIRLNASGRTIAAPDFGPVDLDSDEGKAALRYIRAAIETRRKGAR